MENKAGKIPSQYSSFGPNQDLIQLLFNVEQIVQSHKIKRAEAKKRGETFNIFEILGLQTKETILHSSFIASLLNPLGSHGLSYKPLEFFLNKLKEEGILKFEIDFSQINIEIEYYIGNITSDYSKGGRIDILLRDGKNLIGIENKIDAGDQQAQLVRYYNYLSQKSKEEGNSLLLYLSKFGSPPTDISITHLDSEEKLKEGDDFHVISYKDFILSWLEECRHLAIDNVKVREIIKQYQETIKNITGMNYTNEEKERLFEILKKHIPAVNEIIKNGSEFRDYLFFKKILEPMKEWAPKHNLSCVEGVKPCDGNQGPFGLSFYKKDWNTKMIRIEYPVKDLLGFSNTFIGICWKEIKGNEENSEILPGYKRSPVFPNGYKYLDKDFIDVNLEVLEDDLKIKKILDHYKNQILFILDLAEKNFDKYNM